MEKFNFAKYSPENLERIKKVIKIVSDDLEIQEINRLAGNKIPLKRFEDQSLSYTESIEVLNLIKKKFGLYKIANLEIEKMIQEAIPSHIFKSQTDLVEEDKRKEILKKLKLTKNDLRNNIIVRAINLDLVEKLKEVINVIEKNHKKNAQELNNKNTKRLPLKKLPPNTKWQNITIQFLNGQEIIIKVKAREKGKKDLTWHTNYEEMGFQDERKKVPNKQWVFLQLLSQLEGRISWNNSKASSQGKKHKQRLADALKKYFHITYDPFYPYKIVKAYEIKIKLIPESNDSPNTQSEGDDKLGIDDYLKKENTIMPDRSSR